MTRPASQAPVPEDGNKMTGFFVLNSVFYAVLLWALVSLPIVARRFWRLRAGRCPTCGYPIGESAVCTECGEGVATGTLRGAERFSAAVSKGMAGMSVVVVIGTIAVLCSLLG